MLTIDALRAYGADVETGLKRCVNNEQFYLMLVKKSANEAGFQALPDAIAANDLDAAFAAAHGLKGVVGNLALTPLFDPISEMTELLRAREQRDYGDYLAKIADAHEKLRALCE